MKEDIVRVLRVLEYVGPRKRVEDTVIHSIHGTQVHNDLRITAVTLGEYPEILERARNEEFVVEVPGLSGEKGPASR